MTQILCAQKLWRAVRRWPLAEPRCPEGTAALTTWAGTRFREDDLDLVIAVNAATLLTVVVPVGDAASFALRFASAISEVVEDLGVTATAGECFTDGAISMHVLRDPSLRRVLGVLETYCGIECCYHADLRVIQRNLNDAPLPPVHGATEHCA